MVLITAYKLTVEEEKAVIEQAGADRLLYKPLPKFNELKKILEDGIKRTSCESETRTHPLPKSKLKQKEK